MPIDYSKWDKIELSDDSDIEVHPNVDKRSFIRWKQQSIHEERVKRTNDINNLEFQVKMNSRLNQRVDKMLAQLNDEDLLNRDTVRKFLNANFDKNEKGEGENVDPDMPPYNEMVEDLFEQLEINAKKANKDPKDGSVIREMIMEHRQKIDAVTKQAQERLVQLYKEKASLISSDDFHTGFDKGFVNSKSQEDVDAAKFLPNASSSSQSDVTLPSPVPQFINFEDDVMKLAPETVEFGKISPKDIKKSEAHMLRYLPILSEQQKDALMMSAFEYQIEGNSERAYEVIHQSELIAYVREIYDMKKIPHLQVNELTEVIKMFFQKVFYNRVNDQGRKSFLDSVQAKFDHVKKRVAVMEEEESQEGVETIQLKSLDESTELQVQLPQFGSTDPDEIKKLEAFNKLPLKMQNAVKTQNLDKINDVFAEMPVDEAESVLDIFNEGGIIGINALLEDESEFQELQEQYQSESQNRLEPTEQNPNEQIHEPYEETAEVNTSDVVD
ncbi:LANO_0H05600g1_1 [Lachancea nothofagi CBS 11611]|uniref:Hsp90 chaperone protein kinase-targeting subunit n=1 Tax=Lachancea nothofagi CBS 11611 TaxID=1266666 RepID=A0A1G4KLA2_9SACH|nr:LANO_0H05600g1_1 [Lachancea nothofagi CBS 11611]